MIIYLAGYPQPVADMKDPRLYKHVLFCNGDKQQTANFEVLARRIRKAKKKKGKRK